VGSTGWRGTDLFLREGKGGVAGEISKGRSAKGGGIPVVGRTEYNLERGKKKGPGRYCVAMVMNGRKAGVAPTGTTLLDRGMAGQTETENQTQGRGEGAAQSRKGRFESLCGAPEKNVQRRRFTPGKGVDGSEWLPRFVA